MPKHARPTPFVVPATPILAPAKAGTTTPSASNGRRRPNVVGLRGWPSLLPAIRSARPQTPICNAPRFVPRSGPRGIRSYLRLRLQSATKRRPQAALPSSTAVRSNESKLSPSSCETNAKAGPRRPRHGGPGKKRAKTNRLDSNPSRRRRRPRKMSAAPVAHRGDTGGGEGPTIRDMGTRPCLSRRSSGWQVSAGQRGVYARREAGLSLTPGPRPWGRQPAWPGPAPAHC